MTETCPVCHSPIKPWEKRCRHCHAVLTPTKPPPGGIEEDAKKGATNPILGDLMPSELDLVK